MPKSWEEMQVHVVAELKRLNKSQDDSMRELKQIDRSLSGIKVELARLKAIASMWGAVAGVLASVIAEKLFGH